MEKGQAAIEFLLTYGWVILVFIVAIGALLYFGFLSPETFGQEQCEIVSGLDCKDVRATGTELTLVIENNLGQDVFIQKINDPKGKCSLEEGKEIKNSEEATIVISGCKYGSKGERLKTELDFEYQSSTGLDHSEKAGIVTYIE
ncbi:hypothetical protein KY338_00045 [Candidatus Woesearchaeota archaeon]|nr:hypothetical protein [Candidatus Woesearchaeota archaeon]MBW3005288.1 hypothetical protein [Candidatus Woesearchaeota archaeon]